MNYDDMIIFENQLNDDVPPSYIEAQKIHNPFNNDDKLYDDFVDCVLDGDVPVEVLKAQHEEFTKKEEINYNKFGQNYNNFSSSEHMDNPYFENKEMYYDSFLNEYVPVNPTERINKNFNQIEKSKENDFESTKELFNITEYNNEYSTDIIDQLINIYKETNENRCEFTEVNFKFSKLPINILDLQNLKELVIEKSNLETIEFLPPNIENLTIKKSNINFLNCETFPNSLTFMNLSDNDIQVIINIGINVKTLILDDNKLEQIELPEIMDKVSLKSNKFKNLNFLKNIKYLRELDISNNSIVELNNILDSLEILIISRNDISEINSLPQNLIEFIAYSNKISKIDIFPEKLKKLDLYHNKFEHFPYIPDSLEWLDISFNNLKELPKNFSHLKYIDISSNDNIDFDPEKEDWKEFLAISSKNKEFVMDQHESYIIRSDSDIYNDFDSDTLNDTINDINEIADDEEAYFNEINKFKITRPQSNKLNSINSTNTNTINKTDDEVDEFIWSYNINKKEEEEPIIKFKPKRFVKLVNTYSL